MSKENWLLFKEGEAARSLKGPEQVRRWRLLLRVGSLEDTMWRRDGYGSDRRWRRQIQQLLTMEAIDDREKRGDDDTMPTIALTYSSLTHRALVLSPTGSSNSGGVLHTHLHPQSRL